MNIKDQILETGEYYQEIIKKDTIVLHHTAGGHRPDWTISGWETDKNASGGKLPVCTAYVIGGKSITDGNSAFDGIIYRAHDDKYWGHHLGVHKPNNKLLNQKCIGIEICNYGALTKTKLGFMNYVNKIVPADQVITLDKPFRGNIYWHAYTTHQIASLKSLIQDLVKRHGIDVKHGLVARMLAEGPAAFELSYDALNGAAGIWTHTNYRGDKIDCAPQPQLMDMLRSL